MGVSVIVGALFAKDDCMPPLYFFASGDVGSLSIVSKSSLITESLQDLEDVGDLFVLSSSISSSTDSAVMTSSFLSTWFHLLSYTSFANLLVEVEPLSVLLVGFPGMSLISA